MRSLTLAALCICVSASTYAQQEKSKSNTENIYSIREKYLHNILHNPAEEGETDADNELANFNRWFHMAEVRTYPTGNLPRPDVLMRAATKVNTLRSAHKTTAVTPWQPLGPTAVPANSDGIGRINCIVISPTDTSTLYVGTACGGVWISHNGGSTWATNTDNFPSLSIADIAVNPHNTDTVYAATGDGYGYENGAFDIFWGGLYSAGVMRSTNGGTTWSTTGLSYLQTNKDIVQRLLIHPNKPHILLAATRNGIKRTIDAGATWTTVETGHVYSMVFKPNAPDTVYAINGTNLKVSFNAGLTWQMLFAGISPIDDRSTIAVTPRAPDAIYVLNASEALRVSHNEGATFTTVTSPESIASFYGYYDRVLGISPTDSNFIVASGLRMARSSNGGSSWNNYNPGNSVHADHHAIAFNPLRSQTVYSGNDGGIHVTYNNGASWKNLGNGLMISQIYRMGVSKQNPAVIICGLQDNGTFAYNGTTWKEVTGGDGMDCAISPVNDDIQISSYQNGHFYMSYDKGNSFTPLSVAGAETGSWVSPAVFDPNNEMVAYFGLKNIYATYDQGFSFMALTTTPLFPSGATAMAMSGSSSKTIYAASNNNLFRTLDGGVTWTNVRGTLPVSSVAITDVAVDPRDSMTVYVTTSGYLYDKKVYRSTIGGSTWTNISGDLPNLPVNCIAVDSSTPGALFVGTDMGVYYTDAEQTGWTLYSTGLPNVIVDHLDINYTDYQVRAATYGRGAWKCKLKKDKPTLSIVNTAVNKPSVRAYPNPTTSAWKLVFAAGAPQQYDVKVMDISGRTVATQKNSEVIEASAFASGVYTIEIADGNTTYHLKAVKK